MSARDTLGRLQRLIADQFGKTQGQLTREATLRGTLMLDSLDLVDLAFFIQREFGVLVDPETCRRARSVDGLVQLIESGGAQAA